MTELHVNCPVEERLGRQRAKRLASEDEPKAQMLHASTTSDSD